jgi:hypothetical protein
MTRTARQPEAYLNCWLPWPPIFSLEKGPKVKFGILIVPDVKLDFFGPWQMTGRWSKFSCRAEEIAHLFAGFQPYLYQERRI